MAKRIRIIQTPPGSVAPENIRKQWVGVEMQIASDGDQSDPSWVDAGNHGGHIVDIDDAILALREAGKQEAADFWEEVKSMTGKQLRFGSEFCAVI